jgi:hypothetical protein
MALRLSISYMIRRYVARKTKVIEDHPHKFNTWRLHTAIGGIPPAEHEAAYHAQTQPQLEAGPNN